jgi:hypothetical protein
MSKKYQAGQYVDPKGVLAEIYPNIGILGFSAGTPTYTTGYEVSAMVFDITNGLWYRNSGTRAANAWTGAGGGLGAFTTITGSPAGSTIAVTDRMTITDGVTSGTARVVGGLAYSNVAASTTVGGTSAETVFDTNYTIPANTLKAGTMVKVRYAGFGVAGSGTDTFAHKLYIGGSGGTALISSAALQLATSATFTGECDIICRTAGTTGTLVAFGTYKQSSAEGTMTVKDDYQASTTVNTQANQAIVVTGTWNTSNACSARLDILDILIF